MGKKIQIVGNLGRSLPAVTIGGVTSRVLTFDGRPVVTTRQLGAFFGCEDRNITDNFGNHKSRFREGVHFIRVSGEPLRDFKRGLPEEIGEPMKFAPKVILWTERGAARHAKALTTEKAWSIFEALEDRYFRHLQAPEPITKTRYAVGRRDTLNLEQASKLRDTLESAAKDLPEAARGHFMKQGWSKMRAHFKVHYREIPAAEFDEAQSLLQRHVVGYEPPADTQPAIGHVSPGALLAAASDFSAWLAMAPPLLVQAARLGIDAANEPPRRGQRKAR